ncbi:CBF/Mak21 family-domain-containing protein [Crassisporium funariophilum]|nr:CBF/Mak21 family-domain-containing protein [Crassisporium funariophilum]
MARMRKGQPASASKIQSKHRQPSTKTSIHQKPNSLTSADVLALGGNQADIDLLKDVDGDAVSGSVNQDPALSNDVSKFLKDLNLKESEPKDAQKSKSKGKEKEKAQPAKSSKKKDKKAVPLKPEPTPVSKADTKPQVAEEPKVQLPTKVSFNPKSPFVFQPLSQWYAATPTLGPAPASSPTITPAQLSSLSTKAASLHEADIRTFQTSSSSNSSSSEASFLSKIIQSGTLSDRLSALTLLVQSSPLHNIKALESLKTMAERGKGKGGREESLKALRCIVDWWVGGGAPNRKLKYFRDQPLLHSAVTDQHLVVWYFEDWLKKYFFSVLQILETLSLDPLLYVRTQTITLIFTLLRDKSEQEQNLLRLLVNKLGDTEKALCSRASFHLLQLLQSHPAMKSVIVREIISLVLRPPTPPSAPIPSTSTPSSTNKHIRFSDAEPSKPKPKPSTAASEKKAGGNVHARYYATVTFNQIVLTPEDREVALKLIDVYFEMFKELLGEGNEEVADGGDEDEGEAKEFKTDKGGRIRDDGKKEKGKGKGKGKGKLMEVKGAAGFTEVEDTHSRLVSAILTGVNRALPFAKIEAADASINKHIDTLFLITHTSTFNISLQALVLIQQITISFSASASSASTSSSSSTAKSITDRYYRTLYTSLHDTRLATSSKQAMYLNLFFKSVKADAGNVDGERVKALIRRFVQVLVSGGGGATEFIAGGLYLLGELFSSIPGLRSMINTPAKEDAEAYDARKREPQYAHASSLPLWELTPLLNHYHPAISLHARQLLSSQPLTASADLSQNTLSHFLDRFVYKNPKQVKTGEAPGGKGASAMQPAASAIEGVKLIKGEAGHEEMVNASAFLKRKTKDVPVDQLFFHQYFTRKDEREKAKASKIGKRKDDKEDSSEDEEEDDEVAQELEGDADTPKKVDEDFDEADEDASDADEEEIWKAMKATMPKAHGDEDLMEDSEMEEDDDDLPSDFMEDSDAVEASPAEGDSDSEDEDEDEDEDGDGLSLVEASDNEDLISLDGDMSDGLIEYDGSDAGGDDDDADVAIVAEDEDQEWGGISGANDKKRKRDETAGGRRKKLRSLPTFASYEDYAKLIEDGPEDDI